MHIHGIMHVLQSVGQRAQLISVYYPGRQGLVDKSAERIERCAHIQAELFLRYALGQPVDGLNGLGLGKRVYLRRIYLAPYHIALQFAHEIILMSDLKHFIKVPRVVYHYRKVGGIIGEYHLIHRKPAPYMSLGQLSHDPPFQHDLLVQRRIAYGKRLVHVDVVPREMIQQVIDRMHIELFVELAFFRTYPRQIHDRSCQFTEHFHFTALHFLPITL